MIDFLLCGKKVKVMKAPSNSTQSSIQDFPIALYVPKIWGHEEWIVNNDKYCGKKLVLKKGYKCSLHYHKIKDETFYVLSGKILLELEYREVKKTRVMEAGEIASIAPLMVHRFSGLENSVIIEFSTYHMEEDSYRIESSGLIDVACSFVEP